MHGGRAGERIVAHAEARCELDLAVDRLAHRNGAEHAREPIDMAARDGEAMQLPVEPDRVLRQARRDEWTADAARWFGGHDLADVDPELGEHAADAPRLGIVALLERIERCRLALLDAIERRLQADDGAADAARALDGEAGAGIDGRVALARKEEGALVIERRRLEPEQIAARRRAAGLIEPVTSPSPFSALARNSSADCRRRI